MIDRFTGNGFEGFSWLFDLGYPVFALVFFYILMIPGMRPDGMSFIRKLFYLGPGHVTGPAQRNRHYKKDAFKAIFFKLWCCLGVLIEVCIIKRKHDRFFGQRCSGG